MQGRCVKPLEILAMTSLLKIPVHVEAQIRDGCMAKREDIVHLLSDRLQSSCPIFKNGQLEFDVADDINEYCDQVTVGDIDDGKVISNWQADLCVHAFRLSEQEPEVTQCVFRSPLSSNITSIYCFET
jgi:hypothetical protein